jgi:nicotinamidase-related amidase
MAERVWDRFLTDEDRAHVAARPKNPVGVGSRPALLLIDLYRGVFGDERLPLLEGTRLWPGYCGPQAWDALPSIQELIATARAAGVPVLHVTGLDDGAGMPGWNEAAHRSTQRTPSEPAARERHSRRYDIVDEVAPIEGEVVLRKSSPSAFWGTPLVAQLQFLGIDTIVVAGESTSGCVRASVVEGCTYRFRMQVVEECTFDRHRAAHAINLFDMDQKYADVIPLAQATQYLRSQGAAPAATPEPALAGVR